MSSGWKSFISSNLLPRRLGLQKTEISFIRVCQRVFGKIGKRVAKCEESEETTSVKLKKVKHLQTEDVKIDPTIISPLDLINSLICHRVFGKIGRSTTMFKQFVYMTILFCIRQQTISNKNGPRPSQCRVEPTTKDQSLALMRKCVGILCANKSKMVFLAFTNTYLQLFWQLQFS